MLKKEANEITGGLTITSKMPCNSISLPAEECNIGSKLVNVKHSICEGCYALKGRYNFKAGKLKRTERLSKIYHPKWVSAMVSLIDNGDSEFRWHDSGDIHSMIHLTNIMEVARLTPNLNHWLPTKEYALIVDYCISGMIIPKNMVVRLSSYIINGDPPSEMADRLNLLANVEGFIGTSTVVTIEHDCPAYSTGGMCGKCRMCWSSIPNISYPKH